MKQVQIEQGQIEIEAASPSKLGQSEQAVQRAYIRMPVWEGFVREKKGLRVNRLATQLRRNSSLDAALCESAQDRSEAYSPLGPIRCVKHGAVV